MSLVGLAGLPKLTIVVDGEPYRFSELTVGGWAALQAFIESRAARPFSDLDDHIGDVWPGFRDRIEIELSRRMESYPPQVGSPAGLQILDTYEGRIETLHRGLLVHQPTMPRDHARRFYEGLKRLRDESTVSRVFNVIFGSESGSSAPAYPTAKALRRQPDPAPFDWDIIFRQCAQRLKWGSAEVCRHTLTQIMNALDSSDPNDPHRGQIPIGSLADLDEMFGD